MEVSAPTRAQQASDRNRQWARTQRIHRRSLSSTTTRSNRTASDVSLHTPALELPSPFDSDIHVVDTGGLGWTLHVLIDPDMEAMRDWVAEARENRPPPAEAHVEASTSLSPAERSRQRTPSSPWSPSSHTHAPYSQPDTPIADVEIRLVEPTPVPSRVGSLGGSIGATGLLNAAAVPPQLPEEEEEEEYEDEDGPPGPSVSHLPDPVSPASGSRSHSNPHSPRRKGKGKFFVQSSPSKGSGSDSSRPSTVEPEVTNFTKDNLPRPPVEPRRSSGSSSGGLKLKQKKRPQRLTVDEDVNGNRNVSLSNMRGKFQREKRRVASEIKQRDEAAAHGEESGWEDDEEEEEQEGEWSDEDEDEAEEGSKENRPPATPPPRRTSSSTSAALKAQRRTSSRSDIGDLTEALGLGRNTKRRSRDAGTPKSPKLIPPPAPTPLRRMPKKARQQEMAARKKIEEDLDNQRKREMFAKQAIFGSVPKEGLLSGLMRSGGSMVNLVSVTAVCCGKPTFAVPVLICRALQMTLCHRSNPLPRTTTSHISLDPPADRLCSEASRTPHCPSKAR